MAVAMVGMGAACATGTGVSSLEEALFSGRDGLRHVTRFDVEGLPTRTAGLWPAWDAVRQGPAHEGPLACAATELAIVAAREAVRHAGFDASPSRVAVVLGTCFGENFRDFAGLTDAVAAAIGARGPSFTVSTACASSTSAIGFGRDLIERGLADVVVAGGADVLTREVFGGFCALGALTAEKCAPFAEPPGTSLGEGAGFVVLERADRAEARGARVFGHVLGYGISADAHHETSPDPSGSGVARAARAALADAGLAGEAVDYVNAHATGTAANDASEWKALKNVLGAHADRVPVSATKSFLGHAQGAAGVLELIATLICREKGRIPPTLRAHARRPGTPPDVVADDRPRVHAVRRALKVSAAFGGANAVLAVGEPTSRKSAERRPVFLVGAGAVGPFGRGLEALVRAATGEPLRGGPADYDLASVLRADSRGLDPSSRDATAAAAMALADAKLVVRGPLRERAGVVTGNARVPEQSGRETRLSIENRGLGGIAANQFARMVLNAPAGTAAKLLSLKGPLTSVATGVGSGLFSAVFAAEHLAGRDDADLLVAGGIDEVVPKSPVSAGGAGFVALARDGGATAIRVTAGIAGPDEAALAIGRTGARDVPLTIAATPGVGVPQALETTAFFGAESVGSAWALAYSVALLRAGRADRVVVAATSPSLSCAMLLERNAHG